nr:zinc finger, CCHC-type [Tanacetum cinerariifolium]
MNESISVSSIIDKLPSSWKDFKHTLKHGKDDLSLVQLGSHLRIEESLRAQYNDKGKGKEVEGPSVNMAEEGKNKNNKQNKGKKRGFKENNSGSSSNDRCWFKTYEPVEDGFVLYMGDDHFAPVYGKRSVYEFDNYILSKSGVFVGFGYYNNGHVHYKRMPEMSKDDLIHAIDEDLETFASVSMQRGFMLVGVDSSLEYKSKITSALGVNKEALKDVGCTHIASHTFTFREVTATAKNFRADCVLGEGWFERVKENKEKDKIGSKPDKKEEA